jgi:hypothetical protein
MEGRDWMVVGGRLKCLFCLDTCYAWIHVVFGYIICLIMMAIASKSKVGHHKVDARQRCVWPQDAATVRRLNASCVAANRRRFLIDRSGYRSGYRPWM